MAGVIREEQDVLNLLARTDHDNFRPAPTASHYTPHREEHPNNLQRDIRSTILQNGHIQLPEEALQLVNEIERRALAEIDKLKAELSQERKRSSELEKEVAYYRSQGAPGGGYEDELRSKVAYLENLLEQQRTSGSTGGIDFNALYAQGEVIRQ
jgi:hypothetical protein